MPKCFFCGKEAIVKVEFQEENKPLYTRNLCQKHLDLFIQAKREMKLLEEYQIEMS